MDPVNAIVWIFVAVFFFTAIVTLGGIVETITFIKVPEKYLKGLYTALLLEITAAAITVATGALQVDKTPSIESLPDSYSFTSLFSEISYTIDRLEENNGELVEYYKKTGDSTRLFDGLYSSVLYALKAAPTGIVNALYYGNLYIWDSNAKQLRTKYFAGPYNDEIIVRSWPIEGPRQGIASKAFKTGEVQIVNSMKGELRLKGETRLNALISVPIPETGINLKNSQSIVLMHVDSGRPNVFPPPEEWPRSEIKSRLEQLAMLVVRINRLYRRHIEEN